MKCLLLFPVALVAMASPALADDDTFQSGAVGALIANEYCPDVVVPDATMGSAIFMAAAEMQSDDIEQVSLLLAGRAIVQGEKMKDAGILPTFCATMADILE